MKTVEHLDNERIEKIIRKCDVCFVGVIDGDVPYVLPMNFGFKDNVIYLHSAPGGRVIEALNNNNNICVTFSTDHELAFQHPEVACSYRMKSKSVVAWGKVVFQEDMAKKEEALNIIMEQYSDKKFTYSEPAIRNVKIWEVPIDNVSCKEFGAPHEKYKGDDSVRRTF
ncbi:pyridoxamine 5'-phosphate oxidase family protein [Plebeiibacterium sediminum]|uniref:Pyridoxamine 5'-phosphate oxidase family protein n=1 Tax=Plebeiibacterium sediminum TaxID=2992112 RepID=A0AAE3M0R3_9BACT|nr:pyridoxamine 5'-phosphate oxidase family protein [Plebeiobacterium sediminum]MCW3785024.1 pyridoxamine 5'-phosphate oxidase family protein [Plebeiobacterium sediminum]